MGQDGVGQDGHRFGRNIITSLADEMYSNLFMVLMDNTVQHVQVLKLRHFEENFSVYSIFLGCQSCPTNLLGWGKIDMAQNRHDRLAPLVKYTSNTRVTALPRPGRVCYYNSFQEKEHGNEQVFMIKLM